MYMFIVLFLVVYLLRFFFFKRETTVHLQEPSMPFCGVLNELIKTLCGKKWVKNRPKKHSNHGGGHCNVFTIKLGLKTESPWKKIMFYLLQNVCIRNTGSATMFQPDLEKNKNTNNRSCIFVNSGGMPLSKKAAHTIHTEQLEWEQETLISEK